MVVSACFSPAGTRVLTASVDGTARLWEAATGELIVPPLTHGGNVTAACFSPDGAMILTASRDGTVRLWSPATLPPQAIPEWFPEFAEAMAGKRVNELGAFEFPSNNALGRIQKRLESMRANDPLVRWAMPFFQK